MKSRSTTYWLLSSLLLVICLCIPQTKDYDAVAEPILLVKHIEVEPKFFYRNENSFYAVVVGQLRMDIDTNGLEDGLDQYDVLVVEGYQYKHGIDFSINWQKDGQSYQQKIKQTNQSITPINLESEKNSKISDLHLLLTTNQELGVNNLQNEISFNSIRLDQLQNINQLSTNLSAWNDFNDVKISSINGYSDSQDLPYKSLIFRLGCWLLLVTILFFVCKVTGKHLIFTILLAWAISSFFFIKNHIKQQQQISQVFNSDVGLINSSDQHALTMANHIKAHLQSLDYTGDGTDKLIMLGFSDFFKLRLLHHLQPYDVGLQISLKRIIAASSNAQLEVLLIGKHLRFCNKLKNYDWLQDQVVIKHLDEKFCWMQVK